MPGNYVSNMIGDYFLSPRSDIILRVKDKKSYKTNKKDTSQDRRYSLLNAKNSYYGYRLPRKVDAPSLFDERVSRAEKHPRRLRTLVYHYHAYESETAL